MHDIKNLRKNLEIYKKKLIDRNFILDTNKFNNLDNNNRKLITEKETLEKEKKILSKSKDKSNFEKSKKISEEISKLSAKQITTQNELNESDANSLVGKGCTAVFEGANMPCSRKAIKVWKQHAIIYIPGKASNAGGVAVSGLEMAQNAARLTWSREKVDQELQQIMKNIYQNISEAAEKAGSPDDLEVGANVAGFLKIAEAMEQLGYI